jgi:hypothetical protein
MRARVSFRSESVVERDVEEGHPAAAAENHHGQQDVP